MKSTGLYLKSLVPLLAAMAALILVPVSAIAGGPLDGQAFVIEGEKNEVLSFENGEFNSSACEKYGFGKANYTTHATGEGTAFTANTSSAKHGNMVWTGTVAGDTVKGSYTWTKQGWFRTKTKTKEFTGALKE